MPRKPPARRLLTGTATLVEVSSGGKLDPPIAVRCRSCSIFDCQRSPSFQPLTPIRAGPRNSEAPSRSIPPGDRAA